MTKAALPSPPLSFTLMSFLLWLIVAGATAAASPVSVSSTENELKKLNTQIKSLQQKLAQANDKQSVLHQELAITEKKMNESLLKQRQLQKGIKTTEEKIDQLQQQSHQLDQQLARQQQLLAKHVRTWYQMGEYRPFKWLLNQENPASLSRLMSYYQYIIKSRKQLIEDTQATQRQLTETRQGLRTELSTKHQLQAQLKTQQQHLAENKNYQQTLIAALTKDIQNKQSRLKVFQQNKENLSKLLLSLAKQSTAKSNTPFQLMRRKLPYPLLVKADSLKKMNQGITFFAKEGTPVIAVHPGKVVFSDWLKGYGLLLIIDHGNGFMSLYAHNESLLKRKGEEVDKNEQIASVGHSGGIKENGLYFEIRHYGKAVAPLSWLS